MLKWVETGNKRMNQTSDLSLLFVWILIDLYPIRIIIDI